MIEIYMRQLRSHALQVIGLDDRVHTIVFDFDSIGHRTTSTIGSISLDSLCQILCRLTSMLLFDLYNKIFFRISSKKKKDILQKQFFDSHYTENFKIHTYQLYYVHLILIQILDFFFQEINKACTEEWIVVIIVIVLSLMYLTCLSRNSSCVFCKSFERTASTEITLPPLSCQI